jgi:hypothetical protein
MLHYDIKLYGAITGNMWWPVGEPAGKDICISLSNEADRFTDTPTLRDLMLHVITEHGGDFGGDVRFTEDTTITVTSRATGRSRSRDWPITAFPSISDMVAKEVFSGDFTYSDEDLIITSHRKDSPMARMFVKPLWLVPPNGSPIATTLKEEKEYRRFATRPGLCVTADTANEAGWLAYLFNVNRERVQQVTHPGTMVPVILAQPTLT